jgi:hypothetical protein
VEIGAFSKWLPCEVCGRQDRPFGATLHIFGVTRRRLSARFHGQSRNGGWHAAASDGALCRDSRRGRSWPRLLRWTQDCCAVAAYAASCGAFGPKVRGLALALGFRDGWQAPTGSVASAAIEGDHGRKQAEAMGAPDSRPTSLRTRRACRTEWPAGLHSRRSRRSRPWNPC